MSILDALPTAVHRGDHELPWVDVGDGNQLRVLQIDKKQGLWITETVLNDGYAAQIHRHTGPVFAYTTSGGWCYEESEFVNRPGSYLYEPAGSVHTLRCVEDNTRALFVVFGANLMLDADGNVEAVVDAAGVLEVYYGLCEQQGYPRPDVIVD